MADIVKRTETSQIAAALWEYPPAVCGQHTELVSLHNSKRWCMIAYHIWNALASDPNRCPYENQWFLLTPPLEEGGGVDAYEILYPIIDTDVSMEWPMDLIKAKGAELVTETIQNDLLVLTPTLLY
jgi:D-amino-acid oxidase